MNEIFISSILTSALTLMGGAILFLISKYFEYFYFQPLNELDKLRVEITENIVFHANTFGADSWSGERILSVQNELRSLAAKLRGIQFKFRRISLLLIFSKVKANHIGEASKHLIGLSNTIGKPKFDEIEEKRLRIEALLKIYV